MQVTNLPSVQEAEKDSVVPQTVVDPDTISQVTIS